MVEQETPAPIESTEFLAQMRQAYDEAFRLLEPVANDVVAIGQFLRRNRIHPDKCYLLNYASDYQRDDPMYCPKMRRFLNGQARVEIRDTDDQLRALHSSVLAVENAYSALWSAGKPKDLEQRVFAALGNIKQQTYLTITQGT